MFGYYIEISHANKEKVPDNYIRKQTLVNSERYITPELKEYEDKILNASESIAKLEYELFDQVRIFAASFRKRDSGKRKINCDAGLLSIDGGLRRRI